MVNDDFIKLVKEMRQAQKAHSRANPNTPEKARCLQIRTALEKQVDACIEYDEKDAAAQSQPSLF